MNEPLTMNEPDSDSDQLIILANCADTMEAELLHNALADVSIDAIVDGGELHTALGYIGPALGDVKILIRKSDLEAASEVHAAWQKDREQIRNQPPWFCGKCQVDVEGHFLACWSCSEAREEVEAPFPATASKIEDGFDNPSSGAPLSDPANPWASPGASAASPNADASQDYQRFISRRYAIPAMAASCLSFYLPVVSLVVALVCLYMAVFGPTPDSHREPLSSWNRILFIGAIAIGLMGVVYCFQWAV